MQGKGFNENSRYKESLRERSKVRRLEFHGLFEAFVLLQFGVIDKLAHIEVHGGVSLELFLHDSIPLPEKLLLPLLHVLLLHLLVILALVTETELSALDAPFEAETILLLAVGLLACAEGQVLQEGVMGVYVPQVMHVGAVLLPHLRQNPLSSQPLLSHPF